MTNKRALAVFYAAFDVGVCCLDEVYEGCWVDGRSGPQLDVAHSLATALQESGGIRQRRAEEEANVDV